MTDPAFEKFATLSSFLERDPENPALLADLAIAAVEAGECNVAFDCFQKLDAVEPLAGAVANNAGIAAMRAGEQEWAQKWFGAALAESPDDPSVTFNLAWSHALAGDFEKSVALLNEEIITQIPQAALLDLQIAHELGRFEDAEEKMSSYLEQHGGYEPLQAAASVLAMDLDQPDLARRCAQNAGAHPDALATLGTLDLADNELNRAGERFDTALAMGKANPRAEIGLGLVAMAQGDHGKAAESIDLGAKQFGEHLGSWIAAGWAYLLNDNVATAKDRFETAMQLDDTFSEAHGSLAVISLFEGNIGDAQQKARTAMRLDPACFSGALANMLIAEAEDAPEKAEKILKRALAAPILPDGSTLEQAIVKSLSGAKTRS